MPYFRVTLEGYGIDIFSSDDGQPIVGFFTTRVVKASDRAGAKVEAIRKVVNEWSIEPYRSSNKLGLPILEVNSIEKVSVLNFAFVRSAGYTFYKREERGRMG